MNAVAYDINEDFLFFKHFLMDKFGVVLNEDRQNQITDKLQSVMLHNDIASLSDLTEELNRDNEISTGLQNNILQVMTEPNINWFDFPELMSVFRDYVLPKIGRLNRPYKIWVVGCGKGQTALSLAIEVDKYAKRSGNDLSVEIMATDSRDATLDNSDKTRFKEPYLHGLSDADRETYFVQKKDYWEVNEKLRSMVQFSTANLLSMGKDTIGPVDLIVCPDVLVYYTVVTKTRILELFANALNRSGLLLVGENVPILPFSRQFNVVEHESGLFYQKL